MRYYTLKELESGMVLGRHIYGPHGDLLLAQGKSLDEYFIHRLAGLGFPGAYIEEPGFETVNPPELIDGALRSGTEVLLVECFDKLTQLTPSQQFDGSLETSINEHPELKESLPIGKIRNQVNQIVQEVLDQFACQLPCLLLKAQSKYQVQHAMDTMLLSILLGINFRFLYRELRQLALAALMHDVGKSLLSTNDEPIIGPDHQQYKEHPLIGGMVILRSSDDLFTECATIQQHHERQDGRGFPYGLVSEGKSPLHGRAYHAGSIYRLAEIVSVADAYDVLTAGAYQPAQSPEQALQSLIRRAKTEFNAYVVKMLTKVVQIFPVGCQVRILKSADAKLVNSRGVVSNVRPETPHQCDLILSYDKSGKRVSPTIVSLSGDDNARLELVLQ